MTGRARHGLHLVRDGDAPAVEPITPVPGTPRRPFLSLRQRSVVLAIGGRLDADTAGRLRMVLSMFTVDGGPQELVLDLADVFAVDEEGMAPIVEAGECLRLRLASLRLVAVSAPVAHFLDVHRGRTLTPGRPPETDGGAGVPALDDGRPRGGQD